MVTILSRLARFLPGDGDMVVPDREPDAFALPGYPGGGGVGGGVPETRQPGTPGAAGA